MSEGETQGGGPTPHSAAEEEKGSTHVPVAQKSPQKKPQPPALDTSCMIRSYTLLGMHQEGCWGDSFAGSLLQTLASVSFQLPCLTKKSLPGQNAGPKGSITLNGPPVGFKPLRANDRY